MNLNEILFGAAIQNTLSVALPGDQVDLHILAFALGVSLEDTNTIVRHIATTAGWHLTSYNGKCKLIRIG
jgi:hypothetical protein